MVCGAVTAWIRAGGRAPGAAPRPGCGAAPWMLRRAPDAPPRPLPACGSGRPGQSLHVAQERQTDTPVKNPGSSLELDFRIICVILKTQMSGTPLFRHTHVHVCALRRARTHTHTHTHSLGIVMVSCPDSGTLWPPGHLLVCLPCSRCTLESRMPWGMSALQEMPSPRRSPFVED